MDHRSDGYGFYGIVRARSSTCAARASVRPCLPLRSTARLRDPRPPPRGLPLEPRDPRIEHQGLIDLIGPGKQHVACIVRKLERDRRHARRADRSCPQIDTHPVSARRRGHELGDTLRREPHGQKSVLQAVAVKDIPEALGYHTTNAELL